MEGDDLTFRVNFAGDGVSKLRERVRDKLKEFMGDYTDDTLVDYVIVLLKNGRSKEEAKNELNVFLGDDSDSFISWLWDHLGSNLDLYVCGESCPNKVAKSKLISGEKAQRTDAKNVDHLESEPERGKPNKLLRSRHGKEWKGLVRNENEQPPLRSAVAANFHVEGDICQKVDRLESEPESEKPNNLLRGRDAKEWKGLVSNEDEPPPLRSAVIANFNVERDTPQKVDHTKRSPSPRPVFERKRSRSDERPHLKREEVAKMTLNAPRRLLQFAVRDAVCSPRPSSLSTQPLLKRLRSTVDCRQRIQSDAVKVRSLGNVFDRLGPGVGESDTTNHMAEFEEAPVEAVQENRDSDHIPMETQTTYIPGTASKTTNKSMRKPLEDQDQPAAAVNISVNVNTWKSHHYQGMREVSDVDIGKFVQESEEDADKAGLYSTGHPAEDADSRTIFVNNVHFAASNDSLSRHFNKFGDVLKVLILMDTATGKPKGSAYVEFMSKEAAEQALCLDGTSFMSRILKVVRKSTAPPQEGTTTPFMALRRISRGSVFAASRFGGVPFPRGIASMYRARLPVSNVGGSRSFQWKRGDTQTTPTKTTGVPSNSVVPSLVAPRSLTYVRAETKMDGTSGTV